MKNKYTQVESIEDFKGAEDRWCCVDCGAHGTVKKEIKHYKTCVPGESDKWTGIYEKTNDEETGEW